MKVRATFAAILSGSFLGWNVWQLATGQGDAIIAAFTGAWVVLVVLNLKDAW